MTARVRGVARNENAANWTRLLEEAVSRPGIVLDAYFNFHDYSLRNSLLALMQCQERGLQPGPIATYNRWKQLGRHVKRGEKALTLCMPLTIKSKERAKGIEGGDRKCRTVFVYKRRWFVLSQTDGEEVCFPEAPEWDRERALEFLGIALEDFIETDGNILGYARPGGKIAVSPLAPLPHKTLLHEIGHHLLGHTGEGELRETAHMPRNLREAEAESVALLCCEALALEGPDSCRAYIQFWLRGGTIPERSAQRIFSVADAILRAGRASSAREVE